VAEIKRCSPSLGRIRDEIDPRKLATALKNGGAVGISVITEPHRFEGSLQLLREVRQTVDLPILMKDVVTSEIQVEAASKLGADTILLISALFERGYCEPPLNDMIKLAQSSRLEVLLETHTKNEFSQALDTDAEIIGINNRDLRDLSIDLERAYKILSDFKPNEKIIIIESGIQEMKDLDRLLKVGADAFLIGSTIMKDKDVESKVKELTTINGNF
jgi:indole-3-glycerol phosphate synthase